MGAIRTQLVLVVGLALSGLCMQVAASVHPSPSPQPRRTAYSSSNSSGSKKPSPPPASSKRKPAPPPELRVQRPHPSKRMPPPLRSPRPPMPLRASPSPQPPSELEQNVSQLREQVGTRVCMALLSRWCHARICMSCVVGGPTQPSLGLSRLRSTR